MPPQANTENIKGWMFTFFTCCFFAGIVLSEKFPAILSISMVAQVLCIAAFVNPKKLWQNFVGDKAALIFSFSYLFLLLSAFNSENYSYFFERLQIKLPLLIYSLVIPSLFILSDQQRRLIFFSFVSLITSTALGILINYGFNYEEINKLYLESRIMPGPINHIRFSLLVVFTICFCYYNIMKVEESEKVKKLLMGISLFLAIFLHIYSVRSGLLSFYIVSMIVIGSFIIKTRNIKNAVIAASTLLVIAIISMLFSPTLKNKLINTNNDVDVYKNQEDPNFNSLTTRMVSYRVALDIFSDNFLIGCGQGDLKDETDKRFRNDYPSIKTPIIPHNQFIYYLAATGITGMIIFIVCFTTLLWYGKAYKNELLLLSYVILLISFQFEAMIETQLGVATTAIMLFIPYYLHKNNFKVSEDRSVLPG